jgi:membrane protease YdiL (CAAX protease family)
VNAALAPAGAIYATRQNIPLSLAAPIVAAFLVQISFYLVPGFPEARQRLEARLSPPRLAALAFSAALLPYLCYSLPTRVFRWESLGLLVLVAGVPAFIFVLWPTREHRLTWQDAALAGMVGAAELGGLYRRIYISPLDDLGIEFLGRIMMIGVSATAFLSLRRLEGSGYQLWASWDDWKTGLRQAFYFLPLGFLTGLAIGFGRYRPLPVAPWLYPLLAFGTFIGMYAVVALFEELFFRGVLQNLGAANLGGPRAAQLFASVLFGLIHLPSFRAFPNWRLALLAGLAGWFYGQAYRERKSVVPATVGHAFVITVWRLWFSG